MRIAASRRMETAKKRTAESRFTVGWQRDFGAWHDVVGTVGGTLTLAKHVPNVPDFAAGDPPILHYPAVAADLPLIMAPIAPFQNPGSLPPGEYTLYVYRKDHPELAVPFPKAITVVGLVTQTIASIPINKTRTTLGIGEHVYCRVIPPLVAKWSSTNGHLVFNEKGDSDALFWAPHRPGASTVTAAIGSMQVTTRFQVVAPSGIRPERVKDSLPLPDDGGEEIGAFSVFACKILPDDVSFSWAVMREIIPAQVSVYPDGSLRFTEFECPEWAVDENSYKEDTVKEPLRPISSLYCDGVPEDCVFYVFLDEQYQDDDGNWVTWYKDECHPRCFLMTGEGCVGFIGDGPPLFGDWQGPFK